MNKIQHFFQYLSCLKSIEKTSQLKLERAEKLYGKSQTVIKKYECAGNGKNE